MLLSYDHVHIHILLVLKAERISNGSMNKGYMFPDEGDDLTAYTGKNAQVSLSGGLLQDLCK